MPQPAFEVHGLSDEFLKGKPLFADVAQDFLDFIARDKLIIHNAGFDIGFLNAEFSRIDGKPIDMDRVADTLMLARRKHPGASNSLDALCKRYRIDTTGRDVHGALIDCALLARVYVELIGGHQPDLELKAHSGGTSGGGVEHTGAQPRPAPLTPRLSQEEADAHRAFVATLGPKSLWRQYPYEDA